MGRGMSLAIVIVLFLLRLIAVFSSSASFPNMVEVIWLFIPYIVALSIYSLRRKTIFKQYPKDKKVWLFIAFLNICLAAIMVVTEGSSMGAAPIFLLLLGFEYVISLCMVLRMFFNNAQSTT